MALSRTPPRTSGTVPGGIVGGGDKGGEDAGTSVSPRPAGDDIVGQMLEGACVVLSFRREFRGLGQDALPWAAGGRGAS